MTTVSQRRVQTLLTALPRVLMVPLGVAVQQWSCRRWKPTSQSDDFAVRWIYDYQCRVQDLLDSVPCPLSMVREQNLKSVRINNCHLLSGAGLWTLRFQRFRAGTCLYYADVQLGRTIGSQLSPLSFRVSQSRSNEWTWVIPAKSICYPSYDLTLRCHNLLMGCL